MPRKVIGYARGNATDELSLEYQVAQLQAAGAVEVLTDVQSSMTKERVGFNRLITMIQADQVEAVVVTRFDRMTRSVAQLQQFLDICQSQDVELRVLNQSLRWTRSEAEAELRAIFSWLNAET